MGIDTLLDNGPGQNGIVNRIRVSSFPCLICFCTTVTLSEYVFGLSRLLFGSARHKTG